jgi:hypothetical protein
MPKDNPRLGAALRLTLDEVDQRERVELDKAYRYLRVRRATGAAMINAGARIEASFQRLRREAETAFQDRMATRIWGPSRRGRRRAS